MNLINYRFFFFTILVCCSVYSETASVGLPLSFRYDVGYWNAQEGGLDFTNHPSNVLVTTDFTKTALEHPNFKWKPGFNLGISYSFSPSLEASLDWTYLQGRGSGSQGTDEFRGIFPVRSIFSGITFLDYATQANTFWKLKFNQLNVGFKSKWFLHQHFSLSLETGISNHWIAQRGETNYSGASFAAGVDQNFMKSRCFSVGPKLGFRPKILFGKGFSAYGFCSGAFLLALFHNHQKEVFVLQDMGSIDHHFVRARWNFNASAGLEWEMLFPKRQVTLSTDLGWDYFYFNKQNVFQHAPVDLHMSDNLIISGYHLGLRFKY